MAASGGQKKVLSRDRDRSLTNHQTANAAKEQADKMIPSHGDFLAF